MGAIIEDVYIFEKYKILPRAGGFKDQSALFAITFFIYIDKNGNS